MSRTTIYGALLQDALYQVLDNRMFRLLVLITIVIVAPTFLIGFREEAIEVFWGLRSYSYESLFAAFGGTLPNLGDQQLNQLVIQELQALFVDALAGNIGILFSIAATAFFLPRILEKGSADTVFSKPLARGTLMMARYVSGVLFVLLLASVLVGGMHLGFLLSSGYSDPGFLWSIFTLVYLYAMFHAFSILVGVVTRSSVTAILSTVTLFVFTGCVQYVWVGKEAQRAQEDVRSSFFAEVEGVEEREAGGAVGLISTALDVAHYVLPKTKDADVLAQRMRKSLEERPAFVDPVTRLTVPGPPVGFALAKGGDIGEGGLVWTSAGERAARLSLRRIPRTPPADGSGEPPRPSSPMKAARALERELASRGDLLSGPEEQDLRIGPGQTQGLRWVEPGEVHALARQRHYFPGDARWMHVVDLEAPEELAAEHELALRRFLLELSFPDFGGTMDPGGWYSEQLSWSAPPRFNLFLSIGSTLAFIAAMLGIAWWQLARIDF